VGDISGGSFEDVSGLSLEQLCEQYTRDYPVYRTLGLDSIPASTEHIQQLISQFTGIRGQLIQAGGSEFVPSEDLDAEVLAAVKDVQAFARAGWAYSCVLVVEMLESLHRHPDNISIHTAVELYRSSIEGSISSITPDIFGEKRGTTALQENRGVARYLIQVALKHMSDEVLHGVSIFVLEEWLISVMEADSETLRKNASNYMNLLARSVPQERVAGLINGLIVCFTSLARITERYLGKYTSDLFPNIFTSLSFHLIWLGVDSTSQSKES
jgi:hypothetical protein